MGFSERFLRRAPVAPKPAEPAASQAPQSGPKEPPFTPEEAAWLKQGEARNAAADQDFANRVAFDAREAKLKAAEDQKKEAA